MSMLKANIMLESLSILDDSSRSAEGRIIRITLSTGGI